MKRSLGLVPAMIATGYVSSYDEDTHTAKIQFDDMKIVSYPYQVCVTRSRDNQFETHLDVGEHVVCLCLGNGLETGYVIGTLYDKKNPPPSKNKERTVFKFKDGAFFMYDRELHIAQFVDSFGSFIKFENKNIIVQSAPGGNIYFNPSSDQPIQLVIDTRKYALPQ